MVKVSTIITRILVKKLFTTEKLKRSRKKFTNHDKYITVNDFNKFSGKIFDEKLN